MLSCNQLINHTWINWIISQTWIQFWEQKTHFDMYTFNRTTFNTDLWNRKMKNLHIENSSKSKLKMNCNSIHLCMLFLFVPLQVAFPYFLPFTMSRFLAHLSKYCTWLAPKVANLSRFEPQFETKNSKRAFLKSRKIRIWNDCSGNLTIQN